MPAHTMSVGSSGASLVVQACLQWPIALLAGDQPELALVEVDQSEQVLLKIAAERGRVIGGDPEILVHVKAGHARPVDLLAGDQAARNSF